MNGDETEGLGAVGGNPAAATEELKPLERQRNGDRASPAHREWRAALLWPTGL